MRTCSKCGEPTVETVVGPATCKGCQPRHNPKTAIKRRPHTRSVSPSGEAHGRAKLTAAQASEIRRRALAGESSGALAAEFGVDSATVWQIKNGRIWRSCDVV